MSFSKNFSIVLVCLTLGFVTCKCAPTLDKDGALSLVISNLDQGTQLVRQTEVPEDDETGQIVEPSGEVVIIQGEEEEDDLIEVDEDLIDDEEWEGIWNPEWGNDEDQDGFDDDEEDEDDDDYLIDDNDDWEDDFDYIDNKETADGQ